MQKWEYLVLGWDQLYSVEQNKAQEYINKLGEDGWELVSVTAFSKISGTIETTNPGVMGAGNTRGKTQTDMYSKMFFKRPKP